MTAIVLLFVLTIILCTYAQNSSSMTHKYESCLKMINILPQNVRNSDIELTMLYCGLFPYTSDQLEEFPSSVIRYTHRGIGLWQYPIQFSKYMNIVRQFPINTYVEIGVAAGGTFIFTTEFLKKYNPNLRSIAVDKYEIGVPQHSDRFEYYPYHGILRDYVDHHNYTSFLQGTTEDFLKAYPDLTIDLLLIDGEHSYEGARKDLNFLINRSKIIVLHDIVSDHLPGVKQLWQDVKLTLQETQLVECIDQYEELAPRNVMGIGIVFNPSYYHLHAPIPPPIEKLLAQQTTYIPQNIASASATESSQEQLFIQFVGQ